MAIISEDLILLDYDIDNKDNVIEFLVDRMQKTNRITNGEILTNDVYLREEEASTSMGFGVAIPHAQSSSVLESSVVFIRLKNDITWNDDKGIRLIFGIFVNESNPDNTHLKILAKLARKLVQEEFRERLLEVKSTKECQDLLESINK